jgi:glycosyltransferase involved in cell wall biosynthesis
VRPKSRRAAYDEATSDVGWRTSFQAERGDWVFLALMRVLILHDSYQLSGGEDRAVEADEALLRARGHEVFVYRRSYDEIANIKLVTAPGLATQVFWSRTAYRAVARIVANWRPDVAHFHNIFPLISPSSYAACREAGVPVVQTLHNYRLVCPAGTLLRDGKPCESCIGRAPWPSVLYGCYRGSRPQSFVLASSLLLHSLVGTWNNQVDAYIALTEFGRGIFIRGGLPADRIFVRPNALAVPEPHEYGGPRSAIFVGRLSPEKGIRLLLEAWSELRDVPLAIVGSGNLLDEVRATIAKNRMDHVEVTGQLSNPEVLDRVREAGMLILPSIWYEGLSYSVVEALAQGVPVIASNLGAQAEFVRDGVSGLLFNPGDAASLVHAVRRLWNSDALAYELGRGARKDFFERYSPEVSYQQLKKVYRQVGVANTDIVSV